MKLDNYIIGKNSDYVNPNNQTLFDSEIFFLDISL